MTRHAYLKEGDRDDGQERHGDRVLLTVSSGAVCDVVSEDNIDGLAVLIKTNGLDILHRGLSSSGLCANHSH